MKDLFGRELEVGQYIAMGSGRGDISIRYVYKIEGDTIHIFGPKLEDISYWKTNKSWLKGGYQGKFRHVIILDKTLIVPFLEEDDV
jgi:hypothetical protein